MRSMLKQIMIYTLYASPFLANREIKCGQYKDQFTLGWLKHYKFVMNFVLMSRSNTPIASRKRWWKVIVNNQPHYEMYSQSWEVSRLDDPGSLFLAAVQTWRDCADSAQQRAVNLYYHYSILELSVSLYSLSLLSTQ